jgi:hypothetical protein
VPYVTTRDLKNDIMFRASEPLSGQDWGAAAIDYLNRVYNTLCAGASEFLPEYVDDWWWLRGRGVLTLLPIVTAGTLTVTEGSAAITFSAGPALSTVGYRLRVEGHPEIFEILTHTAAATAATLDSPYTGESSVAVAYKLMKVTYDLDAQVQAITGPIVGYRNNPQIIGISPERMDDLWPLASINPGVPTTFALESEQSVRFNAGGRDDGTSMRVEYRYRPFVTPLTDSEDSVPLVPIQWRHILSDMALTYVFLDKNDDRSNAVALAARTGLAGMLKENRRRLKKMGSEAVGHIYPRQPRGFSRRTNGPLRTESGLIIG